MYVKKRMQKMAGGYKDLSLNKRFNMKSVMVLAIFLLNVPACAETTISLDNVIDTPDRTILYESKDYEIRDIGSYHLGEAVNISINITDIESFQLTLLDKDENFLWNYMVYYTEGHNEVIMPGDVVTSPGTYVFAVFYQGDILAFKPVVFSQYKMSLIPESSTVAPGGTLHVTVRVVPETSLPIKVVFATNRSSLESIVKRTQESLYETEIKIPFSASGRFSLYAAIESDNTTKGYPELLGASNNVTINVTDTPRPVAVPSFDFSLAFISVFLTGLLIMAFKIVRC